MEFCSLLFEYKKVVVKIIGKIDQYYIFKLFHDIAIDYMYIKLVLKNTPTIFHLRNLFNSYKLSYFLVCKANL